MTNVRRLVVLAVAVGTTSCMAGGGAGRPSTPTLRYPTVLSSRSRRVEAGLT